MSRLAILSTHPIQYNAPLFRMLHDDDGIDLHVFFSKTWDQVKYDPDFQREVIWDIPVSEGYFHSTHDASTRIGKSTLQQAIRGFRPDALLVYGWNFPGHLTTMRTFHGKVPVLFRGDSHLLDPIPIWRKALRKLILNWVYRHIDLALTVGTANEAYYSWCGLNSDQWIRAPHAVDNSFFSAQDEKRQEAATLWKVEIGIPDNAKVILFAGKLESKKQPDLLLQAWNQLNDPHCHLLIVGSGPLENKLRDHWGHMSGVHFIGFQNQMAMPIVYRMADVFCLPSSGPGETWGLAINEALASGTTCIVSDRVGCAVDLSTATNYVHVASHRDPIEWTRILKSILTNSQSRENKIPVEFNHKTFIQALHKIFSNE